MKLPRQMIRGRFMESLSQRDIRFVVTKLTNNGADADGLLKLLSDEGSCNTILDSQHLYEAVRRVKAPLPISVELYFYLFLRRDLKAVGLDNRLLAAFLAEGLQYFPTTPRPGVHTTDYEEALKKAKDYEWFVLSVELANRALFLSGIYGEEIYKTKKSYAVASLNRYENIAKACYRGAAVHKLAAEFDIKDVLKILATDFVKIRGVLEGLRERYMKMVIATADPIPAKGKR